MKQFTSAHKKKLIAEIREKMEIAPKKIIEEKGDYSIGEVEEAEKLLKVEFINFQLSDMQGNLKEVVVSREEFLENGIAGKDGSSLYSTIIQASESDMYLVPDLKTLFVLPWAPDAAIILCNSYYPPEKQDAPMMPFKGCGRNILQKTVRKMEKTIRNLFPNDKITNIKALFSPELEFLLLRKDYDIRNIHRDLRLNNKHYFSIPKIKVEEVLKEIIRCLGDMGLKREKYHAEVSTFQFEVGIGYGNVLRIADGVLRAKYIIQKVAERHGFRAFFIPKYHPNVNGCGMHVHQNLVASINGVKKNLFHDPRRKFGLSKIGNQYPAGLLKYVPEYTAIIAPLPISYKRFVLNAEAPTKIYFNWKDRTALVRGHSENTDKIRGELRAPDPMCNPYLAFSAMLLAGLAGIEENLVLKILKNGKSNNKVKQIPGYLGAALELMNGSRMLRKGMGNFIINALNTIGSEEWLESCKTVTDYDIEKHMLN